MDYAQILQILLAFSSNDKKFIEHDFLTGKEKIFSMKDFPSENELWQRYISVKNFDAAQEKIILTSDHHDFFLRSSRAIINVLTLIELFKPSLQVKNVFFSLWILALAKLLLLFKSFGSCLNLKKFGVFFILLTEIF